jgi:hypothetical protein
MLVELITDGTDYPRQRIRYIGGSFGVETVVLKKPSVTFLRRRNVAQEKYR